MRSLGQGGDLGADYQPRTEEIRLNVRFITPMPTSQPVASPIWVLLQLLLVFTPATRAVPTPGCVGAFCKEQCPVALRCNRSAET